jgi:hypothetical protein
MTAATDPGIHLRLTTLITTFLPGKKHVQDEPGTGSIDQMRSVHMPPGPASLFFMGGWIFWERPLSDPVATPTNS